MIKALRTTGKAAETERTLPFFLDANRLFEGWVGVCLNKLNQPGVWVSVQGQSQNRNREFQLEGQSHYFRPDFVVKVEEADKPQQKLVVDAKYKPKGPNTSDLYQVIGYARLLAQPAAQGGDCATGESGLTEACLAIPVNPNLPGIDANLDQFATNWGSREEHGRCWVDGFRLTVVRVPLPMV
nr:hypothetical protein [uncultured Thiodictyon sp.]